MQDTLYLKEKAELRRIKKCLAYQEKLESKKSIINMFSSFLSSKGEDIDEEEPHSPTESSKNRVFKNLTIKVFDILCENS